MNHERWQTVRDEFERVGSTSEGTELRLCLHVLVYYEGSFDRHARDIVCFYQTALPHIRDHLTFYDIDGRCKPQRMRPQALEMLPFWAEELDDERLLYGLVLESGQTPAERGERSFSFYQRGTVFPGFVRLVVPIEVIEPTNDGPECLVKLATDLVGEMRFLCGFAGFAASYSGFQQHSGVYALSQRYRGVDLADPYTFRPWLREGITSVNWLTFVGTRLLARLEVDDPPGALRSSLGATAVHELPHGVMVRAGESPALGEVNRRDFLPAYHTVGRALRRLRIPADALGQCNSIGGDPAHTVQWLARFDG